MKQYPSRKLMAIGTVLLVAGITGGYFYPGLTNQVETTQGTISESRFLPAEGGRYSQASHLTALVTVDYAIDGRHGTLQESVSTSAGIGEQLFGVGNPVQVYVTRGKSSTYATLSKPKPLILIWIGVSIFGAVWIVLGYLTGRPVARRPHR